MKKVTAYLGIITAALLFIGCSLPNNKYEHVESRDGKSVYLDSQTGRVIFVDKSNRINDFVYSK